MHFEAKHRVGKMCFDCYVAGRDLDGERDLSLQRFENVKSVTLATFCIRCWWIDVDKPLAVDVLHDYPKFQSNAQLVFRSSFNSISFAVCLSYMRQILFSRTVHD